MNRIALGMLALLLLSVPAAASAADWDLVKNVKRLERVSPDYKEDKAIDKKFLDILELTEKTKKGYDIPAEAKRIAATASLVESKYMDSFMYYMLVKTAALSKSGIAEVDAWLELLKQYDASPHLLAARLVRIRSLPKKSPEIATETRLIVDWIKARKPGQKVRAPEYTGNRIFGYHPRVDFAAGETPKLYTLATYMSASNPLAGFQEDETYVHLLSRVMQGREDLMTEMVGIYKKAGKRTEAADILFQLGMLKAAARDFEPAKKYLDEAVKLDPKHEQARKERDRLKLEMTYQSLAPAEAPAEAPQAPEAAPEPNSEPTPEPGAATPELSPAGTQPPI